MLTAWQDALKNRSYGRKSIKTHIHEVAAMCLDNLINLGAGSPA